MEHLLCRDDYKAVEHPFPHECTVATDNRKLWLSQVQTNGTLYKEHDNSLHSSHHGSGPKDVIGSSAGSITTACLEIDTVGLASARFNCTRIYPLVPRPSLVGHARRLSTMHERGPRCVYNQATHVVIIYKRARIWLRHSRRQYSLSYSAPR